MHISGTPSAGVIGLHSHDQHLPFWDPPFWGSRLAQPQSVFTFLGTPPPHCWRSRLIESPSASIFLGPSMLGFLACIALVSLFIWVPEIQTHVLMLVQQVHSLAFGHSLR